MDLTKQTYCIYDEKAAFEYARGCFRIYLPTKRGYVNFNIIHSVRENIFADTWRLGQAFGYDDRLENEYPLTPFGAEWDMAVLIDGRDDFIGGSNHGDEIFTSVKLILDGAEKEIPSLTSLTPFSEIKFITESVGYDPADHETKVLIHKKEHLITEEGIKNTQSVEFLGDYLMQNSYLAMMPPLKTLTDSYFTDTDKTPRKAHREVLEFGARSATVFGAESGVSFTMSIPEYPTLKCSDRFFITDNSGGAYNKMYFLACKGQEVRRGDVWHSVTEYKIEIN